MRKVLFTLVILFSIWSVQAQPYKMAAGLRFGYPTSISLKYLPSEKTQLECFAGYQGFTYYSWNMIGATYSRYSAIRSVKGLSWFAGGGASLYMWSWKSTWLGRAESNTSFGILAHGGVDYKFKDLPLNLSLDWMPSIFLNGYGSGFAGGYGALSARYVFN